MCLIFPICKLKHQVNILGCCVAARTGKNLAGILAPDDLLNLGTCSTNQYRNIYKNDPTPHELQLVLAMYRAMSLSLALHVVVSIWHDHVRLGQYSLRLYRSPNGTRCRLTIIIVLVSI